MTTFRVEKTKNYTVMSNHHLRDPKLSLKTKGLLSIMLSLPEDWDYSTEGLQKLTGEGRDSIKKCLKELTDQRYLVVSQTRDARGRMSKNEYVIYEEPVPVDIIIEEEMTAGSPLTENPLTENPSTVSPSTAKPQQLNTNIRNTDKRNTESINHSIKDIVNTDKSAGNKEMDRWMVVKHAKAEEGSSEEYQAVANRIQEQVGLDLLVLKRKRADDQYESGAIDDDSYEEQCAAYDIQTADQVIGYMADLVAGQSSAPVTVNGTLIPRDVVRSKLMKIDQFQFRKVVTELYCNKKIKNPKAYAISMLYNI